MRTLQRTNLYEQVAREICNHIVQNELQVGEKLPSEQELCAQFGVSRASVREGLRLLQILGITEPRVGEGTYIRDISPNSVFLHLSTLSEPTRNDLLDLVEVMEILELQAVRLAIIRITSEKLAEMKSALEAFKAKFGTDQSCVEEDMAFHRVIFQSADNRLLLRMLRALEEFLEPALRRGIKAESPELNYQRHKELYDALKDGDEQRAVSLIKEHMVWTAKNVLEATALEGEMQGEDSA
jgi:GntR family transcriptional repressor for pyruvate dehydrogenase complex